MTVQQHVQALLGAEPAGVEPQRDLGGAKAVSLAGGGTGSGAGAEELQVHAQPDVADGRNAKSLSSAATEGEAATVASKPRYTLLTMRRAAILASTRSGAATGLGTYGSANVRTTSA